MSGRLPFFVYGTLRPGERNFAARLGGRLAARHRAVLEGAVLHAGPGFPYAVPAPHRPGRVVHGDLLYTTAGAYREVLRSLDELEGYTAGGTANHYERVRANARLSDGGNRECWLYVAAPPLAARLRARGRPLPGGLWRPAEAHGP